MGQEVRQPPSMEYYTGLQDLASCNKVYDSQALFTLHQTFSLIKDSPSIFMLTIRSLHLTNI